MAANLANVGGKLIAWTLAGTGTLLVYSAVRSRSPLDVLRNTVGPPLYKPTEIPVATGVGPPSGGEPTSTGGANVSGIPRLRALANQEIRPELVNIPGGGQLDKDAAASLVRINNRLGYTVRNVGAYRSYATQAALHASNPNRFASPKGSLHVAGLAIDVHADQVNDPKLVGAFTAEGWHRYDPTGEPWHWSYGIRG